MNQIRFIPRDAITQTTHRCVGNWLQAAYDPVSHGIGPTSSLSVRLPRLCVGFSCLFYYSLLFTYHYILWNYVHCGAVCAIALLTLPFTASYGYLCWLAETSGICFPNRYESATSRLRGIDILITDASGTVFRSTLPL